MLSAAPFISWRGSTFLCDLLVLRAEVFFTISCSTNQWLMDFLFLLIERACISCAFGKVDSWGEEFWVYCFVNRMKVELRQFLMGFCLQEFLCVFNLHQIEHHLSRWLLFMCLCVFILLTILWASVMCNFVFFILFFVSSQLLFLQICLLIFSRLLLVIVTHTIIWYCSTLLNTLVCFCFSVLFSLL